MDLLSTLPFTYPKEFTITVEEIDYGYMHLKLNVDGVSFTYAPGELCDPLNDLLKATVVVLEENLTINIETEENLQRPPFYPYVLHDIEGYDVTWLFRFVSGELIVVIWDGNVSDIDTLEMFAENNFDSNAFEIKISETQPDFHEDLKFALNCSPTLLAKAIFNAVEGLKNLPFDEKSDWGFKYSELHFDKLKRWLTINERNKDDHFR